MKSRLALLILAAAVPIGAQTPTVQYQDDQANMALAGFTSWKFSFQDAETIRFEGRGNPATGSWKKQGLRAESNEMAGLARRENAGFFRLVEGTLKGAVKIFLKPAEIETIVSADQAILKEKGDSSQVTLTGATTVRRTGSTASSRGRTTETLTVTGTGATLDLATLTRPNRDPLREINFKGPVKVTRTAQTALRQGGQEGSDLTLSGPSLVFLNADQKILVPGAIQVEGSSTASGKPATQFTLRGSRGEVTLYPSQDRADFPIALAEVSGRVRITLDTTKEVQSGQTVPVKLIGEADSLRFDDKKRTLRLLGNVVLSGSDTLMAGRITVREALVTLNEKREIVEIEMTGDPGEAQYEEKRKP